MDPPTYPFEETSFMDGPLVEQISIIWNGVWLYTEINDFLPFAFLVFTQQKIVLSVDMYFWRKFDF